MKRHSGHFAHRDNWLNEMEVLRFTSVTDTSLRQGLRVAYGYEWKRGCC